MPQPYISEGQTDDNVHFHNDGYMSARELNPLRSFTNVGAPAQAPSGGYIPASGSPLTGVGGADMDTKKAHIVRPVVFASPTLVANGNGKPAGIVIGQKSTNANVPVGRAHPRVNVANVIYSPYSTVKTGGPSGSGANTEVSDEHNGPNSSLGSIDGDKNVDFGHDELKPVQNANSTEDINVNIHVAYLSQGNSTDTTLQDINVHEIDNMIHHLQQLQQEFTER